MVTEFGTEILKVDDRDNFLLDPWMVKCTVRNGARDNSFLKCCASCEPDFSLLV